jgi:glutathione S-transferase
MPETNVLYATSHSLYSGRARSYLIKRGIPFVERSPGHETFKGDVLPQARLPTIPTLLTGDGQVIRDGAAIIEHFESAQGWPSLPAGPRQRAVSLLLDAIGCEGLLRPAMHYRWNFPKHNLALLRYHFFHSQRDRPGRGEKAARMMDRMRDAAAAFGVGPDSVELVETLYLEFLTTLDRHLAEHPYLLGGRPGVGDFGLIAPLYAHLGRDPYPLNLMQRRAVSVYRWVERMNRADQDAWDFPGTGGDFAAGDAVPATLVAALRLLSEDFVPESLAAAGSINRWLAEYVPDPGTPAERYLGMAEFEVRGVTLRAVAQPYRFFLLQRLHALYDGLAAPEQAALLALLDDCGMAPLLQARLSRALEQRGNRELWAG